MIGKARIRGLNKSPFCFKHRCCYAWDITFDASHKLYFKPVVKIIMGKTLKEAKQTYKQAKKLFKAAHIHNNDEVVVLFDQNGDIRAIGSDGQNCYIDVVRKISLIKSPII